MKQTALYLVIGALVVLYGAEKCKPDPVSLIPAAITDSLAALERRVAADSAARIQQDSVERSLIANAQQAAAQAAAQERAAQRHRARADTAINQLDSARTAADSLPLLVTALVEERAHGDSLQAALESERSSHVVTRALLTLRTEQRDSAEVRRDEWRSQADVWRAEAFRLEAKARPRWPRWPSKTESFVAGALVGVFIVVAAAGG